MLIWKRELDIYGKVRFLKGEEDFIPFRYQGQYYDKETKLCYNRFRYNSPETGLYISQDPIGLAGNNPNFYAYVFDSNIQVDVFGLDCNTIEKVRELVDKIPDEDKAIFKCKDFASKLKSLMKEAGITGKHIQIQNVIAPNIISKKNGIIGKNKFHEAIEIDSIVFDNLETKGVKLDDWLDDIDFHFNNKYKTQYINILEW